MTANSTPSVYQRALAAYDRIPLGWSIGLAVLLAAGLRFWNLGAASLWVDEMHTLHVADRPALDVLRFPDESPPLNYLVIHFAIAVFGTTEWGLRVVPALLSTASVALMAPIARRVAGSRAVLPAMLMLAVAPLHIHLGREARTYPLAVLLVLASTWALLRWQDAPTPRRSVLHVALLFLLIHTHVFGLFIALAHVLTAAWWAWHDGLDPPPTATLASQFSPAEHVETGPASNRAPPEIPKEGEPAPATSGWRSPVLAWLPGLPRHWWWAHVALAIAALPWYGLVFLDRANRVSQGFWIPPPSIDDLMATVRWQAGSYLIAPLWAILVTWGLWRWRKGAALPVIWWTAGVLLPLLFSLVGPPIFTPRYAVLALPALILLVVRGAMRVPARLVAPVFLVLLLVGSLDGVGETRHPARWDWRGMTADIETHAYPGAYVLFHEGLCDDRRDDDWFCVFEYYQTRDDLNLRSVIGLHRTRDMDESGPYVRNWLANETQAWLVIDHVIDGDAVIDLLEAEGWRVNATRPYGLMHAYELRPLGWTP